MGKAERRIIIVNNNNNNNKLYLDTFSKEETIMFKSVYSSYVTLKN